MRLKTLFALPIAVVFSISLSTLHAAAEPVGSLQSNDNALIAKAWNERQLKPKTHTARSSDSITKSEYTYVPKDEYERRTAQRTREIRAAIARNTAAGVARNECIENAALFGCGRYTNVLIPDELNIRPAGDPAPAAPALTSEELAYIASVRLTLNPPKPMIGPPPSINEWKMAAVGYPMWLWAEGNLNPAPVSESVYDVSVALDAHLVKITYDMGDGHKVTCTNVTQKWTRAVKPGTKSPACGYAYQKPSLPQGSYTLTANAVWAVDWQVNGETGTIPFFTTATTDLPVGELQVLVR